MPCPTITCHRVAKGARSVAARPVSLVHASTNGGDTALCGRVRIGSLDPSQDAGGRPTCVLCARKVAELDARELVRAEQLDDEKGEES